LLYVFPLYTLDLADCIVGWKKQVCQAHVHSVTYSFSSPYPSCLWALLTDSRSTSFTKKARRQPRVIRKIPGPTGSNPAPPRIAVPAMVSRFALVVVVSQSQGQIKVVSRVVYDKPIERYELYVATKGLEAI